MKKVLQYLGLIVLVIVSFIYTEKSIQVVRQKDPIMIEIEKHKKNYKIDSIDAVIDNENIIPGCYGKEVDIEESYENMKKYGLYNETMFKFKNIKPNKSIEDIYDKYIIKGNKSKNAISLIFKVDNNTKLDKVVEVLENTNTKATFFMDVNYIKDNPIIINKLTQLGNEIEHLNYNEEEISNSNKIVSKIDKNSNFCYTENNNDMILNTCKMYMMHTVKPIVLNNNMNIEIRENLDSGSLISLKVNRELNYSLEYMITYIKQKGYKIIRLDEHVDEKYTFIK